MAKKKKRKLKKQVKILIGIIFVVAVLVLIMIIKPFHKKDDVEKVKVEDSLEEYGYVLNENETAYYKELFKELKSVLNKDQVDEEEYAKLVGKLFLADFYNLDNKITKNDIGGVQFVYEPYRNDFSKFAVESIYHYVENSLYEKRDQELPEVTSVEISNIKQEAFEYQEQTDDKAWVFNYTITYKKDLGYQEEGTMTLVHNENRLAIVDLK